LNESGWQHAYSFDPSHSLLYLPTIALLRFTASVVGSGNGFVLPISNTSQEGKIMNSKQQNRTMIKSQGGSIMMRSRSILLVVVLVALAVVTVVYAGSLDSSAAPDATSSYTLEDIYDRLDVGTAGSQSTFTEPSSGPTAGTMHTLNEIMGKSPAADNANGATTAQVLTGKTFWGLRTDGTWGTQTGTMPDKEGDNASTSQSAAAGVNYFTAPEGYYDGDDRVSATDAQVRALDAQITAGNIKSGVDIFGVTGSYAGTICTGDATTADVLYPKTFSNSSSTGLTGELYGGCTCSGTLVGTRWCDNGDGTVTDLLGGPNGKGQCLVWLKDASCIGTWLWVDVWDEDSHTWVDGALTASGILYDGSTHFSGGDCDLSDGSVEGDWRLPTKSELTAITNLSGTEFVVSSYPRAFTGVQSSYYWSSSTYSGYTYEAWYVFLGNGLWFRGWKDYEPSRLYVWPVRGGQ
jgi:hypothetical protein